MKQFQKLFNSKPYLTWYIKNKEKISEKSMFEHVLNYGNWEDFLKTENILGINKLKRLFDQISNQRRVNLRKQTVNYFKNYFDKYA